MDLYTISLHRKETRYQKPNETVCNNVQWDDAIGAMGYIVDGFAAARMEIIELNKVAGYAVLRETNGDLIGIWVHPADVSDAAVIEECLKKVVAA